MTMTTPVAIAALSRVMTPPMAKMVKEIITQTAALLCLVIRGFPLSRLPPGLSPEGMRVTANHHIAALNRYLSLMQDNSAAVWIPYSHPAATLGNTLPGIMILFAEFGTAGAAERFGDDASYEMRRLLVSNRRSSSTLASGRFVISTPQPLLKERSRSH